MESVNKTCLDPCNFISMSSRFDSALDSGRKIGAAILGIYGPPLDSLAL
jgi:hypothetical protein